MHTSSLLKLLCKLDKDEWKRFDKFVRSPYFNANKTVIQLFDHLKKHHPNFDAPKLVKEKVFQKLFPNQPYKEKRMWQLMSDLKGLTEQFLVVEKIDKHSVVYQVELKDIFLEKDLYHWFEQKSNFLEKKLQTGAPNDLDNEFYLHQIHDTRYYNNQNQADIPLHPNLVKANTHLQYYFHLQQLIYACEWIARSYRLKEEIPLFVQSITYRGQYKDYPLYQLYYDTFILLSKPSQNILPFRNLVNQLKTKIQQLTERHQIALLLYLCNYGNKKIQLSQEAYVPLLFDLYKIGLKDNLFVYKGVVSEITFINIVSIATRVKEFDWAKEFIHEFQSFLPKSAIETSVLWAKGIIQFRQGNYQDAVSLLNSFTFDHPMKELSRKSIQLRACLACIVEGDTSYYELLNNKSASFEKYLKRKEILQTDKRTIFLNVNKTVRQLAKLIIANRPLSSYDKLYQQVDNNPEIGAKPWLLKQIEKSKMERARNQSPRSKGILNFR